MRAAKRRGAEVLLGHERGTRRTLLLSPAAILTGQHHDVEPISQDRGRDLVTANNRGGIVHHDVISESDIRELKRAFIRAGEGHRKSLLLFDKIAWKEPQAQKARRCRTQELVSLAQGPRTAE